MKTQEELNTIKEEAETLNNKLSELTENELNKVVGGIRLQRAFPGILAMGTTGVPADLIIPKE